MSSKTKLNESSQEHKVELKNGLPSEETRAFIIWIATILIFYIVIRLAQYNFTTAPDYLAIIMLFNVAIGGISFLFFFFKQIFNLFNKGVFVRSAVLLLVSGIIVYGVFLDLKSMPSASTNTTPEQNSSNNLEPSISPSPKSTPKAITASPKPTASNPSKKVEMVTCIGPDDKQFETSMDECKQLNEKWGQAVDYMINCQIHPDCGGGEQIMPKSQCDLPCAGLPNKNNYKQTLPAEKITPYEPPKATFFCIDNVTGRTYYTYSGEDCNKDNFESQCKATEKSLYDFCMNTCTSIANSKSTSCIYNLTGTAKDDCLKEKDADHQSCMDDCGDDYQSSVSRCYR